MNEIKTQAQQAQQAQAQPAQTLRIKRLTPVAKLPTRGSAGAAGLDLYSAEERELPAGGTVAIGTGIAMALPPGTVGLIADRSGLASRGITTKVEACRMSWEGERAYAEWPLGGVVDGDYRGELRVILHNTTAEVTRVRVGDRVAQLLVLPALHAADVAVVEGELDETARGAAGLGSTGA